MFVALFRCTVDSLIVDYRFAALLPMVCLLWLCLGYFGLFVLFGCIVCFEID